MNERMKIKGVDTVRFAAFFWVFANHSLSFSYGRYGVDAFFVLSSFLLTYLALMEIQLTTTFSKINFFIRRALRLYPLSYAVLIAVFLLAPLLTVAVKDTITLPANPALYFLFLSNFDYSDHLFALKFLWSISVEEQFYLFFLFLSPLLYKKLKLAVILLLSFYLVGFAIGSHLNLNLYVLTTSYFPDFASGMIAGSLYFRKSVFSLKKLISLFLLLTAATFSLYTSEVFELFAQVSLSPLLASALILVIRLF